VDARWTKKNGQTFLGYKNHVKQDGVIKNTYCILMSVYYSPVTTKTSGGRYCCTAYTMEIKGIVENMEYIQSSGRYFLWNQIFM
jgi:hypothetical protein